MNEENMKNYSIRLGSAEIKRLDKLSGWHYYWKRSGIIRGILLAVFKVVSDHDIYNLVRFGYDAMDIDVTITVSKRKKDI